jgi:hypothetical protein
MVVDTDAKLLTLYLNGEPVPPMAFTGSLQDLNQDAGANHFAGEFCIGSTKPDRGAGSFFSRYFKGLIQDVSVYSRALSTGEVKRIFDLTKSRR